jgi:2-oxoisovalerate dehydrogenase E2 component (dihydrolipoyl transacylase)
MPTEIRMPQLGESVHEGTLGRWLKQPGERVAKYEPLVEVITDKVNVEMPSPAAGVLREILIREGQTVAAGTVIALVEEPAASPAGPAARTPGAPATPSGGAPVAGHVAQPDGEKPAHRAKDRGARLSPLVRRLADEHRIPLGELEAIEGTGAGGRVTKDDVLRYIERRSAAPSGTATQPAAAAGPGAAPAARHGAEATMITVPEAAPGRAPGDRLERLSPMRRAIAERMARSKREIPHAYGIIQVDMTRVVRHRETHKDAWREREGVGVTMTAFLVRAAARALRAVPAVNATFTPEGILYHQAIHLGIGVAVPDGLIVPVIKDADRKGVVGLAREIEALVQRARQGKLTLDDVSGGTFTLTNPGVFGSIYSMPIINYPQAAILSADAIVRRPVVVDEGIAIREIMHLGLAFDHRIFDGAVAMQFLTHIRRQLEEFAPVGESPEF